MSRPEFKIVKKSKKSRARLGIIKTTHGVLHTPAFFPVATQACVKTLTSEDIKEIGFEGILCNTYHLMLRPGSPLIKQAGGLHKFMNFKGVIATDNGGFQVFSLGKGLEQGVGKIAKIFPSETETKNVTKLSDRSVLLQKPSLVKIRESGAWFKSHIDGQEHFLSPEKSIKIQQELGADIIFALDECTSPLDGSDYTKKAMERTHRWAKRCLKQAKSGSKSCDRRILNQGIFGIVQGGEYEKLRTESAKFIGSLDFDGFGIGGSLGKSKKRMFEILDWTIPLLPEEKPRHLLGIGYLEDLEASIKKGVDLFDCCYPTRMARHGVAFTSQGELNLTKAKFLPDRSPLDKKCSCPACQNYSRGYISHLLRAKETTALRLLTLHNLWFFKDFIDTIREKIAKGKI